MIEHVGTFSAPLPKVPDRRPRDRSGRFRFGSGFCSDLRRARAGRRLHPHVRLHCWSIIGKLYRFIPRKKLSIFYFTSTREIAI